MSTNLQAVNEPVRSYESGSDERKNLQIKYDQMASEVIEIPLIIGGKEVKTGEQGQCVMPHDHQHVLGNFHMAGENEVSEAIESSMLAWNTWSKTCLLYTSPSPRDRQKSRMPSSA